MVRHLAGMVCVAEGRWEASAAREKISANGAGQLDLPGAGADGWPGGYLRTTRKWTVWDAEFPEPSLAVRLAPPRGRSAPAVRPSGRGRPGCRVLSRIAGTLWIARLSYIGESRRDR